MRVDVHYTLTQHADMSRVFGAAAVRAELAPRYNIVPGQLAPACIVRESDGARSIESLRWGLLPRWKGHGGKRGPMIHTPPLDAVPATPLLRDAFKKSRCLVIADGCYAWRELKQPIWFHPDPLHLVALAGVWAVNEDDGIASFALLLGPPLATRVHDPMPIVLAPEHHDAWLDPKVKPDAAAALCAASPTSGVADWRADIVSTRMSSGAHDDAECIAPLGNPNQGSLF